MLKPSLWKLPCYKLMFLNALIDIWGIVNSCFISGYLSIEGVVFCSYPDFQYIYSTIILSLWSAQCITVLILAFNRCVEFWQNPTLTSMFEGKNIVFWYALPIVWYFVNLFYLAACPFNTVVNMWMIDPYLGIPDIHADKTPYENVVILNVTNLFTFFGLSTCYLFLIFSIWYKGRHVGSAALSKIQRQVSIQACLICSIIYMCDGMYCFFEFFPQFIRPIFLTMDFFCWQWGFCGVIVIYMFMNKTLRHGVIEFYMGLFGYEVRGGGMGQSMMSQIKPSHITIAGNTTQDQ
ncbi:hypothetical protein L596_019440 [Steinernema carpocapsae]|uniref:G-protein coupled receptors family 1 profile domain-containing protein n=1 Tax=Steinernema carpocapsae TaxID=34508 RepID=A0A4U5MQJ1_STECR|nr:hypothetical protein L596_019440 [Steinernema carpocapsae]